MPLYFILPAFRASKHVPEAQIYTYAWDHPNYSTVAQDIVRFDMGLKTLTAGYGLKRKAESMDAGNPKATKLMISKEFSELMLEETSANSNQDPTSVENALNAQNINEIQVSHKCKIILKYLGECPMLSTGYPCCDLYMGMQIPPEIRALIPPKLTPPLQSIRRMKTITPLLQDLKDALRQNLTQLCSAQ
ncbi:hypothetical protein BGX38DRAFT_1279544 [Terfezia claveryi]|nr:hypothetical protein BGX38DRAFT_1279544 [Terfezia claveryi]